MPVKTGNSDLRTPQFGAVVLHSQVVVGGGGAISAQTPSNACGFVVTKGGVGQFTLTFDEKWDGGCIFAKGLLFNQGTEVDAIVELEEKYDPSAKTVKLMTVVAGSAADPSSGDELWLEVTMSNRTVAPPLAPV